MMQLTISEARTELLDLPEKLAREPEHAVIITRRGQPVLAILPWEFYESLVETLEVLSESELMAELHESVKDIERGRLLSHEELDPDSDYDRSGLRHHALAQKLLKQGLIPVHARRAKKSQP